jgi:hypothetical protein
MLQYEALRHVRHGQKVGFLLGCIDYFYQFLGDGHPFSLLPRPALSYLEAEQAVDAPATHHG